MANDRTGGRRPGRREFKPTIDGRLEPRVLLAQLTAIKAQTAANGQAVVVTNTDGQTLTVPEDSLAGTVMRDGYGAVAGAESLAAGGTNRDWAEMVLLFGEFPRTDSNITVVMRWMRQENGPEDWWNRNNPLNNGWGSGGGSGLGSYDSLVDAANYAAIALHGNSGYSGIVAGLSSSAPTGEIESAIWASPWATSHYGNGSHWSLAAVPVISAPADAW